jgi:CheY-like chemotaxis protein
MSHDIRTPLNGIIGMTYLAKGETDPAKITDYLGKIDTSSKFLLGLVNDILDMSKAESGKLELHPEPYPESEFFRYLDSVIAPLCQEKNIQLVLESNPLPGYELLVDPLRINQVFFNLLSNAVKFTPEGGTVTCRLEEERISEHRAAFTGQVIDTGIGMSEEFLKVLFDPFTQENRKDISETRGTGLGLSIVKKIMDAMQGTVKVESRRNEGTTFTVHAEAECIPAKSAEDAENAQAQDSFTILAGRHVLVCEDHPLNREIATALLEEKKMIVGTAEDGRLGITAFQQSPIGFYDAILMDIRMPVLDGFHAARGIRALDRPDAGTVPIIAMTADAFSDDIQKCLEAGMDGHVAKPIDPHILYETLGTMIEKRQQKHG